MHVDRTAEGVEIQAPAKLNLFFEVLAKRNDGYHEIESLMCPIDLYDTLRFRENSTGQLELKCRRVFGAGGPSSRGFDQVSEGPDNLVMKAIELVRRRTGVQRGATLRLIKRIPAAAGLGGGSSDAAAALAAANVGWSLNRPPEELMEWAAEIGSDVPFFLVGGPAICRGRGEKITPVAELGTFHGVVVRPPEGLSTAAVYGDCRPAATPRKVGLLVEALRQGDWKQVRGQLWNRLQPAAERLSPWIRRLQEAFSEESFLGHGMSGSGTSYFGLCRHARHARRLARRLEANGLGVVFAVRSCR